MATAKQIIQALSYIIDAPYSTVEAYAAELRRVGWWPKTKRGRGATAMSDKDAAKLLLAILARGPKSLAGGAHDPLTEVDGTGFFLRYANMRVADPTDSDFLAIKHLLNVSDELQFLDLIQVTLTHLKENKDNGIFAENPLAALEGRIYRSVEVSFSVSGPHPSAEFQCMVKDDYLKDLIASGVLPGSSNGMLRIGFVHQMLGLLIDARAADGNTKSYMQVLEAIRAESELGLTTHIGFGGRELLALARQLSGKYDDSTGTVHFDA